MSDDLINKKTTLPNINSFKKEIETNPGFRARFEFDKYSLTNNPSWFIRNFSKLVDQPYAKDFLMYAVIQDPQTAIENYRQYKNQEFAGEVIAVTLEQMSKINKDPFEILFWFNEIVDEEKKNEVGQKVVGEFSKKYLPKFVGEVLDVALEHMSKKDKVNQRVVEEFLEKYLPTIVKDHSYRALQYYHLFKDKPYGDKRIKEALNIELKKRPDIVMDFLIREPNFMSIKNEFFDKALQGILEIAPGYFIKNYTEHFKDLEHAKEFLEKAAKNACKLKNSTNDLLNNQSLIEDEKYYDEVINEAFSNIPEDGIHSYIKYYKLYEKRPDAKDLLLKAIKNQSGFALYHTSSFKDAPFYKEALEIAVRQEAKDYYGDFSEEIELFKDEPYAEEVLKIVIDQKYQGPFIAISNYHRYQDKPYRQNILNYAIKKYLENPRGYSSLVSAVSKISIDESLKKKFCLEIATKDLITTVRSYETYKDKAYAKEVLKLAIEHAMQEEPSSLLSVVLYETEKLDSDIRDFLTDEIIEKTVGAALKEDSVFVLAQYKHFKTKIFSKKVMEEAINESIKSGYESYRRIFRDNQIDKEVLESAVRKLATIDPGIVLNYYDLWKDEAYAKEVLAIAAEAAATVDPFAAANAYKLYKDQPYADNVISVASKLCDQSIGLLENLDSKKTYLNNLLGQLNPHLKPSDKKDSALDLVEMSTGHKLIFTGVNAGRSFGTQSSFEFVFINLPEGDNYVPIRLAFQYDELKKATTKDEVAKLIKEKIEKEKIDFKPHQIAWSKKYGINIPIDGSTAVMLTALPGGLGGLETDYSRLCEIYITHFNASIYGICMGDKDTWDSLPEVKKMRDDFNLPPAVGGDDKEIFLEMLKKSLIKAIDDKKNSFILHYTIHGTGDGRMNAGIIFAREEDLHPEEIAEVLTSMHNGKLISEQIDLIIIAESCNAKVQKDKIFTYLEGNNPEKKKPAVKDLTMVASSPEQTSSFAATSPRNASVASNKTGDDLAGTFNYNFSNYFELVESHGLKINQDNLFKFIDRMSQADSPFQQDLQIFQYINIPESKEELYRQFGSLYEKLKAKILYKSLYGRIPAPSSIAQG